MEDIIKSGYQLFIKRQENGELIGTLTLKDDNNYKDIDEVENREMKFIEKYPLIEKTVDYNHALSVVFLPNTNEFLVSIKSQTLIGEYQDQIIWENMLDNKNKNLDLALYKLNEKLNNKLEGSLYGK